MSKTRLATLSLVVGASAWLAACGGSDPSTDVADASPDAADVTVDMTAQAMDDEMPEMVMRMSTLSGQAERPEPVLTTAQAEATYMVFADSIGYSIVGLDVKGVTAVHIHRGGANDAGPVLVTLSSSPDGVDVANGSVASGTITRETALAEGVTFDELRELVQSGGAYTNIHTRDYPGGELRAQTTGELM
jgi:hypothetical protein